MFARAILPLLEAFTSLPQSTQTVSTAAGQHINVWADARAGGPRESYRTGLAELPALALQIGDFPHADPMNQPNPTVDTWRQMWTAALAESLQEPGAPLVPFIETYNLFNHENFGNGRETNANYGKPIALLSLVYQPRMVQLGFRATF